MVNMVCPWWCCCPDHGGVAVPMVDLPAPTGNQACTPLHIFAACTGRSSHIGSEWTRLGKAAIGWPAFVSDRCKLHRQICHSDSQMPLGPPAKISTMSVHRAAAALLEAGHPGLGVCQALLANTVLCCFTVQEPGNLITPMPAAAAQPGVKVRPTCLFSKLLVCWLRT